MSEAPHSRAHLEILRLKGEIATAEARGAARAVERCRRLAEEYAAALEASGQHYAAISVRELRRRIEVGGREGS